MIDARWRRQPVARVGECRINSYLINQFQFEPLPLGPQSNWQSQVFRVLQKIIRVRPNLTSGSKIFQRAGTTTEKALLLDPTSQNSLTDGIGSMLSLPGQGEISTG